MTLPRIDAIAAKDKAGKLWLEITNLDLDQLQRWGANLTGFTAKSTLGESLPAAKSDIVNTCEAPGTAEPKPISMKVQNRKLSLILQPKSVTVLSVGP